MSSTDRLCPLQSKLGKLADVGFRQAMQQKWVAIQKTESGQVVQRKVTCASEHAVRMHAAVANLHAPLHPTSLASICQVATISYAADVQCVICSSQERYAAILCSVCAQVPDVEDRVASQLQSIASNSQACAHSAL